MQIFLEGIFKNSTNK